MYETIFRNTKTFLVLQFDTCDTCEKNRPLFNPTYCWYVLCAGFNMLIFHAINIIMKTLSTRLYHKGEISVFDRGNLKIPLPHFEYNCRWLNNGRTQRTDYLKFHYQFSETNGYCNMKYDTLVS